MSLRADKEILVKYIVNLAHGIDNCLGQEMWCRATHDAAGFLSQGLTFKGRKSKDKVMRYLYTEAHKREKKMNINTVPYNYTLVAFVTAFETLLYDIFSYVVNNNKNLKEKILNEKRKVMLNSIEKYKNNQITFADIVSEAKHYNFQNLDSANDAFIWAKNKNIFKILSADAIKNLRDIIEKRHKIVHEAYNDNTLNFAKITKMHAFFLFLGLKLHGKIVWDI